MSFIQVEGLRKTFQMGQETVHALRGVDLDIPNNAFCTIVGPSGSGKSTLLYLLGGLDRPTTGRIWVDGKAIDQMDENQLAVYRRQKMGFIFQSFNLVSSMTALDNVAFPMRFGGVGEAQRKRRAADLLKRVGLEKRAYHKPTELSGGQQQRVAIARALVNNPQIIIADEPTGNLDRQSSAVIMQMLIDLHAEGRTVLMVTHDPNLTRFATHIIRILDGHVVDEDEFQAQSVLLTPTSHD